MLLVADEVYSLHKSIYYFQESHGLLEHHRSSWESTPPAEGLFWLISGGRLPMSRDAAKRRFRAVPRVTSRKRVLLPRHNCISTFLANWPFFPTLQDGVTLFIHAAIRTFTHWPHLSSTYSAIGITTAKVIPGATMKTSVNRQINQRQPSSWAFLVITNAASRCSLSSPRSSLGTPPSD